MRRICYKITDHGIADGSYLVTHEERGTKYDTAILGCGDTYNEALNDCFEQISQCVDDIHVKEWQRIENESYVEDNINKRTSVYDYMRQEISNTVSPEDYADMTLYDCGHEYNDFCESCHNAVVEHRIEHYFYNGNEVYYYVEVLYSVLDTPLILNDTQELSGFAFPGCYALYYMNGYDVVLCSECATVALWSEDDKDYPIIGDINYEDNDLYCECGKQIEPSYET
jgi:hypothetical protein